MTGPNGVVVRKSSIRKLPIIPQGSLLLLITQPARYRIFDWHSYDNTTVVYGTG